MEGDFKQAPGVDRERLGRANRPRKVHPSNTDKGRGLQHSLSKKEICLDHSKR